MSHPQPPQRQPSASETNQYAKALHNTAIVALIACPALAFLPPRKLDFYTFGLFGGTIFSANFLIREQTGRSIWQHVNGTNRSEAMISQHSTISQTEESNLNRELQYGAQEIQRLRSENADGPATRQVKNQRDAWKTQRQQEIKEDVEEGKGFGDMITDQIWEVWNWGKKKDDDEDDDS